MLHEQLPRLRERDGIPLTVEQAHPVETFQLAHMLGHGRLAHEQFLRSLGKAEVAGHTVECFQTEIRHRLLHGLKFLCPDAQRLKHGKPEHLKTVTALVYRRVHAEHRHTLLVFHLLCQFCYN